MLYIFKIFLVTCFYCYFVECLIPTLNVQKRCLTLTWCCVIIINLKKDVCLQLIYGFLIDFMCNSARVQVVDRKLIQRKRKDTFDMCKMFTEENERLQRFKTTVGNHNFIKDRRRMRRDLNAVNTSLNYEDAKRIENIVDKLYDDMAENGQRVTYRQRELFTTTVQVPFNFQNDSGRRFEFAPEDLLAPLTGSTKNPMTVDTGTVKMPWIKKWKHGIVPFYIDPDTYDSQLSEDIIKAFDYFEKATCIRLQRLRERPTDKESLQKVEWLYITNPSGIRQCVHSNERKENKGVQMVVFGYDCLSIGEIVHEVMHILGFSHEHTRPDRDQYITVLWDNIKPGYKKYFEMRSDDPLSSLPYDYDSVLHYPPRAFSKNGQITLMTQNGLKIGQREGLSGVDITKITTIFGPDCMERNKEYLLKTCPRVVNLKKESENVTQKEIEDYFRDRLWPYGIVNYSFKQGMDFSIEEKENIYAVIRHIEKETCIEFRDITMYNVDESEKNDNYEKQEIDDNQTESNMDKAQIMKVDEQTSADVKENVVSDDTARSDDNKNDENEIPQINSRSQENVIDVRKNLGAQKLNFPMNSNLLNASGSSKASTLRNKHVRRKAATTRPPGRRHAESTFTFVRSLEPGCRCPTPGKPQKDQVLEINADCFNSVNDLLHLFVHILGLDHQHNMHDRDSYLHILWDNLTPDIKREMQNKLPPAAAVGFPYDYQSVMHYPWLQIKNGVTNIMYPIWNDGWAMGHWQGLSSTDVHKLNLIYFEQCSLRRQQAQGN